MARMAGTDSLFLSMETESVHGHVGGLAILDPSEAKGFSFQRVKDSIAERVLLAPRFTQKILEAPLGLARPRWIEDPDFDVSEHLHRAAVPSPGGIHELAELAGYLFSRKLDRRKPLWEFWFIEGLAGGRVALLQKCHHCLMDGVTGADLATVLCDLEPSPKRRKPGPARPRPQRERVPSDLELWMDSLLNVAATPVRVAGYTVQAIRRGARMLSYLVGEDASPLATGAPRLSINGSIGPRRAFACSSVALSDLKSIKNAAGVKLNDVVIELSAAALLRYLNAIGEKVDGSIAVGCAMNTRTGTEDASVANRIATYAVSAATDIADPAERLQKIHENSNRAKEMTARARSTPIASIGEVLPPLLVNLGFRTALAFADQSPLPMNALVSNVPGPPIPLYVAGARMESLYPLSILAHGAGLNVTVMSFMDRVDFGFTVDPDLVPDPWFLADGIQTALAELESAVEARTGRIGDRRRGADSEDTQRLADQIRTDANGNGHGLPSAAPLAAA